MGILNWARGRMKTRREAKLSALAKAGYAAFARLYGKDAAALAEEGGWEMLGQFITKGRSEAPWLQYTAAQAEAIFGTTAVMFACAKKIADTSGVFPYGVQAYDRSGDATLIPDHAMSNLLEHPNDKMSYCEFMYNLVIHLEITGVSYVWKLRNGAGIPIGLWPFPTSWVKEMTDKPGFLRYYHVEGGEWKMDLTPEDMIVIRYPAPSNPLQPAGPTRACFKDLQLDDSRADYLIELMENMHLPGPVLTQQEIWTSDQMRKASAKLTGKVGKGKRGSPLFLGGPGVQLQMVNPLSDMDWPGTAGLNETRICAAYEVPPILIHLRAGLDRATYSNYETAKRAFFEGKMTSLARRVADGLSLGLLHAEGEPDNWFEPVTDDIPELQEDATARHERARADFLAGGLAYDEYLERIGSEPVGGRDGDMRILPMGASPFYPNEEPPEPLTEAGTEDEEEEGFVVGEEDEEGAEGEEAAEDADGDADGDAAAGDENATEE